MVAGSSEPSPSYDGRPRLVWEQVDGVTIAGFTDAVLLSEETLVELDEQLRAFFDALRPTRFVLSLRGVRFVSSTFLAIVHGLARRASAGCGRLKVCCVAPGLAELFRLTRLDRLLEIHDSEAAALDAFDRRTLP